MHIPEHYLDPTTCVATAGAAACGLGFAMHRARMTGDRRLWPVWIVATTGIFAAQMVNFPIQSGTSGHLLGATLAAILLGPWAGMTAVALVLAVQCLVFGDGGLTALGANTLNMAVIGCLAGSVVHTLGSRYLSTSLSKAILAGFAAWFSVVAAAGACSLELVAAGKYAWADVAPAMLSVHALIGLSEALITTAVVALVWKIQPRLLRPGTRDYPRLSMPATMSGIGVAMLAGITLSPLSSTAPDGLEAVLSRFGLETETANVWAGLLPNYSVPGISSPALATSLAAAIGVAFVAGMALIIQRTTGRALARLPRT